MRIGELPVGLEMALAQNPEAMKKFAMLSSVEQQKIIDGTHTVQSRQEMRQYVNSLLSDRQ